MKLADIRIRDPYVLVDRMSRAYYLYGTTDPDPWKGEGEGFDAYFSTDLENWNGPFQVFKRFNLWATKNYWAPEVHIYEGKYYMLASFYGAGFKRGTQILVSNEPLGLFTPLTEYPITPSEWDCLDGTLWIENGKPYIVFCHEWTQIVDGTICALELSKDLKSAVGEPKVLFSASEAEWAGAIPRKDWNGTFPDSIMPNTRVTDGPFIIKNQDGGLIMIWSGFNKDEQYSIGQSCSTSLLSKWTHIKQPIFEKDGGHGMIFTTFDKRQFLAIHKPNNTPMERPFFMEIEVADIIKRKAD